MNALPARTQSVARCVAATMFDPGTGIDRERMDWFLADINAYLLAGGIKTRLALWLALTAVQWTAPFFSHRWSRFTSLPSQSRVEALERFEVSPLAILFTAIKAVFCLIYFEHPRTLMDSGLDPRRVWPGVDLELPGAVPPEVLPRPSHLTGGDGP